jgi:cysteine-rich repeat protein
VQHPSCMGVVFVLGVLTFGCGDDERPAAISHPEDAGAALDATQADAPGGAGGWGGNPAVSPDARIEASNGGAGGQAGGGSGDPDSSVPSCPSPTPPPAGAGACGDGWRDALSEECDDGNADETDLCSSACRVQDSAIARPLESEPSGRPARSLGTGRHVVSPGCEGFGVAYVEGDESAVVSVATFDEHGVPETVIRSVSAGSKLLVAADPVILGIPGDKFVVAWNDIGGDGDLLGVAMTLVEPASPESAVLTFANASRSFSQFDPDVLRVGSEIIVAWIDDAALDSAPDIRFRRFDLTLAPLSDSDETLAESQAPESGVALAPFGDTWAAAWRTATPDGEVISVRAGPTSWQVAPGRAGPADDKPALVELDPEHLLVVFGTQVSTNVFGLKAAVLETAQPGEVESFDVEPLTVREADVSHSQPSATRAGERVYLAWRSTSALGSADAEELWLKEISWTADAGALTVDLSVAELPLPRAASHRSGDQRVPGLATAALWPDGAIAAVWEDHGRVFGAGESATDVIVELIPAPLLRLPDQESRRE